MYGYAVQLIEAGKAYVDEQTAEDIAAQKGTPTTPGTASPFRDRSVEDNLRLFQEMKDGKHAEGSMVLRAKIDMAHANMHMRDPFMYRIKFAHHHRTGDDWCIYPMYDFAHGQSDSIEAITHSLCSLEFENHRPLYDWYIEHLGIFPSKQREFARLNLNYTIMSKRKLLRLVEEGVVDGWDDPRMPTLSGLRRRGYSPESIREFCDRVGVAKRNNVIDVGLLEFALRSHLNATATRAMAVLRPIKLVVTNYPEGQTEWLPTENNPEDPSAGTREHALQQGTVHRGRRLQGRGRQQEVVQACPRPFGPIEIGVHRHLRGSCGQRKGRSDRGSRGIPPQQQKRIGHQRHQGQRHVALGGMRTTPPTLRCGLYDRLFTDESPDGHKDRDFMEFLNPASLEVLKGCKVEPALAKAEATKAGVSHGSSPVWATSRWIPSWPVTDT